MGAYAPTEWTPPLVEILRLMHPVMDNAALAELLGLPDRQCVSQKAHHLRLKKPKETRAHIQVLANPQRRLTTLKNNGVVAKPDRIAYTNDKLPYRAQVARGPVWVPPPDIRRGQHP